MLNIEKFSPPDALFCPILCKELKYFGASRHLRLYFAQFFVKNGKFSALRAIWNMLWRFSIVLAWKNREEIGMFWFEEGKNWNFWPKYLPLVEISWFWWCFIVSFDTCSYFPITCIILIENWKIYSYDVTKFQSCGSTPHPSLKEALTLLKYLF